MYDYQLLEKRLTQMIEQLGATLGVDEKREVLEFVNAGEYGIALETLCDILVERPSSVPRHVLPLILEVSDQMEMREMVCGKLHL